MGINQRLQVNVPHLEISGLSDLGRIRTENEDFIYLHQDGCFMLLADGMGGHERGAEASETAIHVVKEFLGPETIKERLHDITDVKGLPAEIVCLYSLVEGAIQKANSVLYERNQALRLDRFMGTTMVGLVPVEKAYFVWFHVGDSRLYLLRDGRLTCLTTDHSAHKEWEEKGMKGREPERNIITRAVGPNDSVVTDINWDRRKEGDTYILCSDGLTDLITDEEVEWIIKDNENASEITDQLVEAALRAGGKDNISVIVCRVL